MSEQKKSPSESTAWPTTDQDEGSFSGDLYATAAHEALARAKQETQRNALRVSRTIGANALTKSVDLQAVEPAAPTQPPVPPHAPKPPVVATKPETQPENTSFSSRVGAMTQRYAMSQAVKGGPALVRLNEDPGRQPLELPLQITRDGRPMEVLSTLSVGNQFDAAGRRRNDIGASGKRMEQAIDSAQRNYAVIRDPGDTSRTFLMELRPDEIAAGRSDFASTSAEAGAEPDNRFFSDIPATGMDIKVPISNDPYEQTAGFNIRSNGDSLQVNDRGFNPGGYVFMTHRV